MARSVRIETNAPPDSPAARLAGAVARRIEQRTGIVPAPEGPAECAVRLEIGPDAPDGGYRISVPGPAETVVTAREPDGLAAGAGRFLRDSAFSDGVFEPSRRPAASAPTSRLRGMYFATHFHNFYHEAPLAEIGEYVEDLALWGFNALNVWFDMHHYRGFGDPAAQAMIARLRAILGRAAAVGMKTSIGVLANEGFADSPEELRSVRTTRAHYGVEICPGKPGGLERILAEIGAELDAFADVGLDYLWIWPYDQGGCACPDCSPWGANGFLRAAEPIARAFKARRPSGQVILSTWLFDMLRDEGEWTGLTEAFRARPDWADYILADSHGDFPAFPLTRGVPGGLPLVNFPEISMRSDPWPGYGANPLPGRYQRIWNMVKHAVSGGFPYSEGIYEDMNKVVCGRFYWDRDATAAGSVAEYAAYEFSPDVAADVSRAVGILESNQQRRYDRGEERRFTLERTDGVEECFALLSAADGRMPRRARNSWRWRILYLRALLDREIVRGDGRYTEPMAAAFDELRRIFHADKADPVCRVPARDE